MIEAANNARAVGSGFQQWKQLFSPLYRPQLVTIIAMAAFNQLDGINTIMFYVSAPCCTKRAGGHVFYSALLRRSASLHMSWV